MNLKATTVTFVFTKSLPRSSTIVLEIDYQGCLNNQMAGFYRSTYKDSKGVEKIVASTQFESLDARRAFPCVDEPAAKATFAVTLTVPNHLECFSNMPESRRKTLDDDDDLVEISFLPSPKMSTYLVAFCVGEFDFVQAQTQHGVLVKVYAPRGRSDSCHYALDCAVKSLDAYNDFFGINYPLPKLDMVAIPEFVSGYSIPQLHL
jgi:puromycin-sensitive aminopeptidase